MKRVFLVSIFFFLGCVNLPAQETKNDLVLELDGGFTLKVQSQFLMKIKTCRFELTRSDDWRAIVFTGRDTITLTPNKGFPIRITKSKTGFQGVELHPQSRAGGVIEDPLPPPGSEFVSFYELVQETCKRLDIKNIRASEFKLDAISGFMKKRM